VIQDRSRHIAVGVALAAVLLLFVAVNSFIFGFERVGRFTFQFIGVFALGYGFVLRRRGSDYRWLGPILLVIGAVWLLISVCLLVLEVAGLGRG
jgi:hypothetical protein